MTTPIGIPARTGLRLSGVVVAALAVLIALVVSMKSAPQAATGVPPPDLRDTGLYADVETLQIDARHLAFAPQYPLWTDGATKRRWISLPPGSAIDASDPDAWVFPAGTRLWKEFSFGASASRRAPWSGRRTASGAMRPMRGARTGASAQLVPAKRQARRLSARRRALAHHPGRERLQGVPPGRPQRGARLRPDLAFAGPRSGRAACRSVTGVDVNSIIARGLLVGLPQSARAAPLDRSVRDRARSRRLSAWQLRALPQRAGPVAHHRAVPAPDRRSRGGARHREHVRTTRQEAGAGATRRRRPAHRAATPGPQRAA